MLGFLLGVAFICFMHTYLTLVLLCSKEFELMVRGEWLEKDDLKISFHDIIDKIQNEQK